MDWKLLLNLIPTRLLKSVWTYLKRKIRPPLTVELPEPVNPLGRIGMAGGITPAWSVRVRFINRGQDLVSILELQVSEEDIGNWAIDEVFLEGSGARVQFPIQVQQAFECWVRMRSPRTLPGLPIEIGRLRLRVRDHTQRASHFSSFPLTTTPTQLR